MSPFELKTLDETVLTYSDYPDTEFLDERGLSPSSGQLFELETARDGYSQDIFVIDSLDRQELSECLTEEWILCRARAAFQRALFALDSQNAARPELRNDVALSWARMDSYTPGTAQARAIDPLPYLTRALFAPLARGEEVAQFEVHHLTSLNLRTIDRDFDRALSQLVFDQPKCESETDLGFGHSGHWLT